MKNESIRYSVGSTVCFYEFLIDRYDCISYNYEEFVKILQHVENKSSGYFDHNGIYKSNSSVNYIGIYKNNALRKVIKVNHLNIAATINEVIAIKIELIGDRK